MWASKEAITKKITILKVIRRYFTVRYTYFSKLRKRYIVVFLRKFFFQLYSKIHLWYMYSKFFLFVYFNFLLFIGIRESPFNGISFKYWVPRISLSNKKLKKYWHEIQKVITNFKINRDIDILCAFDRLIYTVRLINYNLRKCR